MLAFEFDKGKLSKLSIVGGLQDIVAETTCMLYVIYSTIKKNNKKVGEIFKKYLESAIKDGIIFCDDDEREKIFEKTKKENDRDFFKEIEQMLQELKRKK